MEQKLIDLDMDILEILRKELWDELRKVGAGQLTKYFTVTFTENDRMRQYDMAYYRASINALVKTMAANHERRITECKRASRESAGGCFGSRSNPASTIRIPTT